MEEEKDGIRLHSTHKFADDTTVVGLILENENVLTFQQLPPKETTFICFLKMLTFLLEV